MRRAVAQYHMIEDGDSVAVGISGGKDSLAMLAGLIQLQAFIGIDFTIKAATIDIGFGGMDFTPIRDFCQRLGIEHRIKQTDIKEIVFDQRQEKNPCSLCARMRRGALHDLALQMGCKKVALGHHYDDVIETFMMNLLYEGRIGTFSPVTWLSRKEVYVIRPLIFAPEREIKRVVRRMKLPVVESRCPMDKASSRETTAHLLLRLEKEYPGFQKRVFGAIGRAHLPGW